MVSIQCSAGTSATTPIVEWMVGASRGLTIPAVEFHEGSMEPDAAVVVGWTALREVFGGWGIMVAEDLTTRLCQEGFSVCSWKPHIRKGPEAHFATSLRSRRQSGVVGSHVCFDHRASWASVGSP